MSLEIINFSKVYENTYAVKNFNLKIEKGEILGLLGPNGAGKSTLMKSIAGSLKIDSGQILLNGLDISTNEIDSKRNIGFLAENNPLYKEMYVKEYLGFVANIYQINSDRVKEVIELLNITSEQSKKIKQLSKGYQQRVGLAQAILHEPELLVLDEATNGLDPNQLIEIRQLIKEISYGRSIIFSTHILQEVEAICTRIVLINKGELVLDASIDSFKNRFSTLEDAFISLTH